MESCVLKRIPNLDNLKNILMVDLVMLHIVAGSPDGLALGQLEDLSALPPRAGQGGSFLWGLSRERGPS